MSEKMEGVTYVEIGDLLDEFEELQRMADKYKAIVHEVMDGTHSFLSMHQAIMKIIETGEFEDVE